jgi:hypothetical protein
MPTGLHVGDVRGGGGGRRKGRAAGAPLPEASAARAPRPLSTPPGAPYWRSSSAACATWPQRWGGGDEVPGRGRTDEVALGCGLGPLPPSCWRSPLPRPLRPQVSRSVRFVGLSTALANAQVGPRGSNRHVAALRGPGAPQTRSPSPPSRGAPSPCPRPILTPPPPQDLADWLGIGPKGLFNFKPSVRPVPLEAHIQVGAGGPRVCKEWARSGNFQPARPPAAESPRAWPPPSVPSSRPPPRPGPPLGAPPPPRPPGLPRQVLLPPHGVHEQARLCRHPGGARPAPSGPSAGGAVAALPLYLPRLPLCRAPCTPAPPKV